MEGDDWSECNLVNSQTRGSNDEMLAGGLRNQQTIGIEMVSEGTIDGTRTSKNNLRQQKFPSWGRFPREMRVLRDMEYVVLNCQNGALTSLTICRFW